MHFDPYESKEHIAMVQLLESADLTAILSAHTGMTCSVRETGLSLTKPNSISNEGKSSADKDAIGEDISTKSFQLHGFSTEEEHSSFLVCKDHVDFICHYLSKLLLFITSSGSTHPEDNVLPDSFGTLYGQQEGGEGMEWHSDGAKGEFTMLMSFSG